MQAWIILAICEEAAHPQHHYICRFMCSCIAYIPPCDRLISLRAVANRTHNPASLYHKMCNYTLWKRAWSTHQKSNGCSHGLFSDAGRGVTSCCPASGHGCGNKGCLKRVATYIGHKMCQSYYVVLNGLAMGMVTQAIYIYICRRGYIDLQTVLDHIVGSIYRFWPKTRWWQSLVWKSIEPCHPKALTQKERASFLWKGSLESGKMKKISGHICRMKGLCCFLRIRRKAWRPRAKITSLVCWFHFWPAWLAPLEPRNQQWILFAMKLLPFTRRAPNQGLVMTQMSSTTLGWCGSS